MRVPLLPIALLAMLMTATSARGAAPHTFELPLPRDAASGSHWRTPPLHATGGFDVVGGEWRPDGPPARVELRAQRASGRWTRWAAIVAGEPVVSGRAVAVQLRGARPLRELQVHAVAVGSPARGAHASGAVAAAGGGPAIVPRSVWDPHDACHPRVQARYGRVDFAVVHHTESLSTYPPSESAALVLGICLFHRDGNGWNDIGYDLLVDRYGTVFEGRAGGVDAPVIGAQAGGWNTMSTGVAMIGSYALAPPPDVALRALERVLAWKLSRAGVPAQGSVTERSLGGERGVNAYPRGALVRFQRIAGHRDADFTECPGAALYAELPRVRRVVAALMAAPRDLLTLAPVGAPIEPAPWWLTGRLARADGRRPAGIAVRVEQQGNDGAWRQVAATRTGADGIWSATPTLLVNGSLRAVATLPDGRELASPSVATQVRDGVRLTAERTRLRRGGTLQLTGLTSPPKPRVRVRVERRVSERTWRRVSMLVVATDASGRFALPTRLAQPGVYRVLATTRADATNAAGASRMVLVRVR
ncbi:MAG TPA: N-acetylmuramoyl-L-alanine amidase [Conexibacter sp.]|nr:N-acetylmuramoyl-L-alanine amidase [Conexibacter sp.]